MSLRLWLGRHTRYHTTTIGAKRAIEHYFTISMTEQTGSTTVCMVSPQRTQEQAFYLACGECSESCSNEKYGEDFSGNRKSVVYGCQKLT